MSAFLSGFNDESVIDVPCGANKHDISLKILLGTVQHFL